MQNISNANEKNEIYKVLISKYQKAIKHEYHFEAMMILYAIIEDRTTSFLYHIGFTSENEKAKASNTTKQYIISILGSEKKRNNPFKNLHDKLNSIKIILNYGNKSQCVVGENTYMSDLQKFVRIKAKETKTFKKLSDAISELDKFRELRNKLTHDLCNFSYENINICTTELDATFKSIRVLDSAIGIIKRKNFREEYKIK